MLGHKQHPIGQIPNFTHVEIFMIPPKMRNWQNSMAIKLTAYFLFKKQQSQNLVISRFAGWLTKFVTTLDSMIIPFQTPGTTTCLTVDHHHLTFLVDFILEVHAPVFAVPLFFTCASCKILQPSTINKPSRSHKIQKLIPCIPSESSESSKSKVQGFSFSHLLAVFPFLRFPVEDLIQARQHGGNTQGHSRRPRTQRLHGGKEKHRFPSFCFVCVYMFLCVKVSTGQKIKIKL